MFSITKTTKGRTVHATATGSLDESANLEHALGPLPEALVLQCKLIPRVSAAGLRTWIRYFSPNRGKEQKAKITEVSPALLDAFQAVPDALLGVQVESVIVPFACGACGKEWMTVHGLSELRKRKFKVEGIACPECGAPAPFDDDPSVYFAAFIDPARAGDR